MKKEIVKYNFILLSALLVIAFLVPSALADVSIAPWFPQGSNFVFFCNPGFAATSYDWNFGDGQSLNDVSNDNVWHTYNAEGIYEVACTASDGVQSETSLLRIKVGTDSDVPDTDNVSLSLDIAPYYPQGPNGENYVFECNAQGFTPTSYDWNFGDGQKLFDLPFNSVYHSYSAPGEYEVDCTASDGVVRVQQSRIIVGGIPETPTQVKSATVSIASGFPQGNNFVFNCETSAFAPATYTWNFGDGEKLVDVSNSNVWHTFAGPGHYMAECEAKDATGANIAKGTVDAHVE